MLLRSAEKFLSPTVAVAATSWTFLLVADANGLSRAVGHHALLETLGVSGLSILVFALSWLSMLMAMMLPLNRSLIDGLFLRAADRVEGLRSGFSFVASYTGVWLAFGLLAFLGDAVLHGLAHSWPLLRQNEWLISAALLLLVGAYQLLPLKARALGHCESLSRGALSPEGRTMVARGLRYARGEVVCCGNLMLLALALGHSSLVMLLLTTLMIVEKALPKTFQKGIGWALLGTAGVQFLVHS